ncbi:hypothetical protein J0S82_004065 [Galemys pyrenaicus]|uniref:Uncharacterized protein n=1 Tax=Galemys pyrenaicus TaxID=202257 RepID=A0A8J6A8Z0_GALPY|nr:hypothetical protein J0S82_004065 [Galemys pyrenaicus]
MGIPVRSLGMVKVQSENSQQLSFTLSTTEPGHFVLLQEAVPDYQSLVALALVASVNDTGAVEEPGHMGVALESEAAKASGFCGGFGRGPRLCLRLRSGCGAHGGQAKDKE